MRLTVGKKVVYRGRGPCLIGPVVEKVIGGRSTSFYRLSLLDDSRGELFIPVNDRDDLDVRALLDRSDIPKLLDQLKARAASAPRAGATRNRREHSLGMVKLLESGSAFDLASLVEKLTRLNTLKVLAPWERQMLNRARKLLACEVSEVLNESRTVAEARIDGALDSDNERLARVIEQANKMDQESTSRATQ